MKNWDIQSGLSRIQYSGRYGLGVGGGQKKITIEKLFDEASISLY